VAEEVVGEKLLGSAELAVGSVGWGDDRSGLPPVRGSLRKTTVGKSRGPGSLAGAAGRLLAKGRGAPFGHIGQLRSANGKRSSGRCGAEQRGVWPNGEGKSEMDDDSLK
jgi:hypothetical protein